MPASYEKINYSLRPAKSIERKMLCDTFRRLSHFAKIESYRYVGFGSTYFSDFILFHKALGIKDMVSIEQDRENEDRFNLNRPFQCITMGFGHSNEVLPLLSWNMRTILWLDYDGQLDKTVLTDIAHFCANALSGSMITVTVNAHQDSLDFSKLEQPYNPDEALHQFRLQRLIERVGAEKIPSDVSGKNLNQKEKANVYRRIITNEIDATLKDRNGGLEAESKIQYRQLFNFHYQDGAKMLTVGGLLYEKRQSDIVYHCGFEELSFVRTGDDPYLIEIPSLTYRELRYLDTQLPFEGDNIPQDVPIPEKDLKAYAKIYRYFPTFAEAEI
ncbi:hypothetical protein HYR99_31410 [Candidatus Poribacteria bacterium]|nr:hypothetical protein [Candidatus Poribacteria bacterium]